MEYSTCAEPAGREGERDRGLAQEKLSDVAVGFSSRLAKPYLVPGGELFVSSDSGTPAGLLGQPFGASHLSSC
jgi:hypothetical protein